MSTEAKRGFSTSSFDCIPDGGSVVCRKNDGTEAIITGTGIRTSQGKFPIKGSGEFSGEKIGEDKVKFQRLGGGNEVIVTSDEIVVREPGVMRRPYDW